jgi:hypothetical protein
VQHQDAGEWSICYMRRGWQLLQMFSLGQRLGVKGFFCVVQNNISFKMEPEWYFMSKELKNYMEITTHKWWVTSEIGMKLEAFAIAGCNPVSAYLFLSHQWPLIIILPLDVLHTAAQKINFMKGKICSLLNKNLGVFAIPLYEDLTDALVADVSGVPDVRIRWTWFEEDVV